MPEISAFCIANAMITGGRGRDYASSGDQTIVRDPAAGEMANRDGQVLQNKPPLHAQTA